jgi:two-component system nitrogen regulation response regulator GlnG
MTTKQRSQADELARGWFQARPSVRRSILVVEEAGDLRQLNAEVLIDAGYQVDVTEDIATAWTALQLYRYGLLVTDQFLPEASVVELITKVHTAQRALPVIMVTNILPLWEFALHPCLENVKILRKPYTIEKLLGLVKHALSETAVVPGRFASLTNSQSHRAEISLRPRR